MSVTFAVETFFVVGGSLSVAYLTLKDMEKYIKDFDLSIFLSQSLFFAFLH